MLVINSYPANETQIDKDDESRVQTECSAMILQLQNMVLNRFKHPSINFSRFKKDGIYGIEISQYGPEGKNQLEWLKEKMPLNWDKTALRELNEFNYYKWDLDYTYAAYKQGWGLFYRDDRKYAIQKLDSPDDVSADLFQEEFKGKVFESDEEAIEFVKNNKDCPVCQKALKMHEGD